MAGLDGVPALNSTTIMELDTVPEHLLVLGGGYIGLEFGQMFRRFGSRVTVVQRGAHCWRAKMPTWPRRWPTILREDGIEVLLETERARGRAAPAATIDADRAHRRTASAR